MNLWKTAQSWLMGTAAKSNSVTDFENLAWLEPEQNPFGVRVLDCRPFSQHQLSATSNPNAISFFMSPEAYTGEQFRDQRPDDAITVACDLKYECEPFPEGPLFVSEVMEDKWNIYRFGSKLYFARSWTGQLCYVATLADSAAGVQLVQIEAWNGNVLGKDDMAVRQVDFLIRSHLFNQERPHPAPNLSDNKSIALWSFSQYGRRGWYAVVESD